MSIAQICWLLSAINVDALLKPISLVLASAAVELSHITEVPKLEADVLMEFVLGQNRISFYREPEMLVSEHLLHLFQQLLQRRLSGEPISYLIGEREFWSMTFSVTPEVLIPRPETELLVCHALRLSKNKSNLTILDLGTGSGAIALALAKERPDFTVYASDISTGALRTAENNAKQHNLKNVHFILSDWLHSIPDIGFDFIISNPPYLSEEEWPVYQAALRFEPKSALISGQDGLNDIRAITEQAPSYLNENGYLLIEHGHTQAKSVRRLLKARNLKNIITMKDLNELPRLAICQR